MRIVPVVVANRRQSTMEMLKVNSKQKTVDNRDVEGKMK